MKAAICERYGPPEVLHICDVEKPVARAHEVLIKIMASAVNSADVRVRGLKAPEPLRFIMRIVLGFRGPRKKIPGVVLSGIVEAVGKDVSLFAPGDDVFASTGFQFGAHAEYVAVPEKGPIALKPKTASFEEAASILFGGTTALYFLQKAGIGARPMQSVLVYGSSGAVGTAAVQIAKHYGAEVTAVCSEEGVQLAESLGANHVITYTKEDFTKNVRTYDIIFDAVGKKPKKECLRSLAHGGKYATVASLDVSKETKEQLKFLSELYDAGAFKAVIDTTFSLHEIVEAHRYVELGKKKGNVVLKIG